MSLPIIRKGHHDNIEKNSFYSEMKEKISLACPRYYVNKISEILSKSETQLIFLYLPTYGEMIPESELDYYRQFGDIWFPPDEIIHRARNRSDPGHLNKNGANLLSIWLAEKIATWNRLNKQHTAPIPGTGQAATPAQEEAG